MVDTDSFAGSSDQMRAMHVTQMGPLRAECSEQWLALRVPHPTVVTVRLCRIGINEWSTGTNEWEHCCLSTYASDLSFEGSTSVLSQ